MYLHKYIHSSKVDVSFPMLTSQLLLYRATRRSGLKLRGLYYLCIRLLTRLYQVSFRACLLYLFMYLHKYIHSSKVDVSYPMLTSQLLLYRATRRSSRETRPSRWWTATSQISYPAVRYHTGEHCHDLTEHHLVQMNAVLTITEPNLTLANDPNLT